MQIRILKPGILSTIQDMGRKQYLASGVPVAGCMDNLSGRLANLALGNDPGAAVIEFTYGNAAFSTDTGLLMAYSGNGAVLKSGALRLESNKPLFVPAGTTIELTENVSGTYTYLAVAGGWDVSEVMGSRSTYTTACIGGLEGRSLKKGDVLKNSPGIGPLTTSLLNQLAGTEINYPNWSISPALKQAPEAIRVVKGPEFGWFNEHEANKLFSNPFTLSGNSNRMGYQLDGPLMKKTANKELLSTAVVPGTLQVTGNGQMILLMADCQTTGGYPRIAQVIAADLHICAQSRPNNSIIFKEVSRVEAERLYIELELELQQIRVSISYKIL